MKKSILSVLFLLLFAGESFPLKAREVGTHAPALDSTVVVNGDTTIITYSQPKFSFGDVVPFHSRSRRGKGIDKRRGANICSISIYPVDTTLSVGTIPFVEGTTPSGGRTYSIPIMTASYFTFAPQVAIVYNSQSGVGCAGSGWDLSGLSSITVINKNLYYHGTIKAADKADTTAVYAIDGEPLVTNDLVPDHPECQYITTRSKVLVKRVNLPGGCPKYFEALFPDGTKAVYGDTASTYPRSSYLLAEQTNAFGYKIRYTYCSPQENGYIDKIEYGYLDDGISAASLQFHYAAEQVFNSQWKYYAGTTIRRDRRLSSVVSLVGNEELRTYSLQYDDSHSFQKKDLLRSIQCSVGQTRLNRLRFEYAIDESENADTEDFERCDSSFLLKGFNPEKDDFLYKRGKFSKTTSKDGFIIYPDRQKYAKLKSYREITGAYGSTYGSRYQWDQSILIFTDIENGRPPFRLETGMGFQTLEAVDADGDGTDEIIKINTQASYSDGVDLRIVKYKYNEPHDTLEVETSHTVRVPGTFREMGIWSPVRREYFFGDFMGLGRDQLLTASFSTDSLMGPYVTIIDLMNCRPLYQRSVFLLQDESIPYMVPADMNYDGRAELYVPERDCLKKLEYDERSNEMVLSDPVCSDLYLEQFETDRIKMGNFNGDGYLDFVAARRYQVMDTDSLFINDGKVFHTHEIELGCRVGKEEVYYEDINKDGLTDIVTVSNDSLFFYINRNQQFSPEKTLSGHTIPAYTVVMPGSFRLLHDTFDLVAIQDSVMVMYKFRRDYVHDRLLTVLDNGTGVARVNTYGDLASSIDGVYSETAARTYSTAEGYQKLFTPFYLLRKEEVLTDSTTVASSVTHRYFDAAYNSRGLGFCSFGKVRTEDNLTGMITEQTFDPEMMGCLTKSVTRHAESGTVADSTLMSYMVRFSPSRKLTPLLSRKDSYSPLRDVDTHEEYLSYDEFDYPTRVMTTWDDMIVVDSVWKRETINCWRHGTEGGKYLLGKYCQSYKTEYGMYGDSLCCLTLAGLNDGGLPSGGSVFACEHAYHPGDEEGEEPWSERISRYSNTYDAYGRLTEEKKASQGSTAWVTKTYGYSGTSPLPSDSYDEYGRWTEYEDYDKYGNPGWLWNESEYWRTDFSYDAWGERTGVRYHDGTRDTTATRWSSVGLYEVWTKKAGKPETVVHYDVLGREIRRSDKRFDGSWRHVDTEYDSRGQVSRVSLPYKGSAPCQWTSYVYDAFGRLEVTVNPNGREDTFEYDGRHTITVRNGVTRETVTDARGDVRYVYDDAGQIYTVRRADGQPDSTWVSGGGRAGFAYDRQGRRTRMEDRGAGVHTWSYSIDDATGAQTIVHTSPEGTVTSTSDKFGRMVSRQNGTDFSTVWNYSDRLLMSEVSTNGTRKDYTYDDHERLTSVKETSLDGKWLKQVYTYNNDYDGQLNSTLIICNTDTLGTEKYYYENGYRTVTSFLPYNAASPADTVLVWKLTSENDLGLPTEGRSAGNIQRTYAYDAFGRPTRRTLGSVMDFGYTYDINDNLSSRSDNIRNLSESFSYDNLDRLTGAGLDNRTRTYAPNGNVTADSAVGTYIYGDSANPYRQTGLNRSGEDLPTWKYDVAFTSFSRPASVHWDQEEFYTTDFAEFDYDGSYQKSKVGVGFSDGSGSALFHEYFRYYFADRFESEYANDLYWSDILYLGGDAYSAPVALKRGWIEGEENPEDASWSVYNIGRDNLGSITHVVSPSGTKIEEVSYDPWGRPRSPSSWELYDYVTSVFSLSRGYGGHSFLYDLGIYHANARLYDPLTGRFLGYDPYVQDPDNTQNWNRYSYCLNNPFRYSDPGGEFVFSLFLGPLGAYLDAACWGALIGGASYALSVAFSDKGLTRGWDWAAFGISAGMGAVSSILGFTAATIKVAGIIPGIFVGSATGAATGALSGYMSNGINNVRNGLDWNTNWGAAVGQGALVGGILGGIGGGIKGYSLAHERGLNNWWGSKIKNGRKEWSFFTSEKPYETIQFDINDDYGYNPNDCVPSTLAEINDYYAGGKTYGEFYSSLRVTDEGTKIHPKSVIEKLFNTIDTDIDQLLDPVFVNGVKDNNQLLMCYLNKRIDPFHFDVVRYVSYYTDKVKVGLRLGTKTLTDLDLMTGWWKIITGLRY